MDQSERRCACVSAVLAGFGTFGREAPRRQAGRGVARSRPNDENFAGHGVSGVSATPARVAIGSAQNAGFDVEVDPGGDGTVPVFDDPFTVAGMEGL